MSLPLSRKHTQGLKSIVAVPLFVLSLLFALHVRVETVPSASFSGGSGFFVTAQAAVQSQQGMSNGEGKIVVSGILGGLLNILFHFINVLLWVILSGLSVFLSLAVAIFGWAVEPGMTHDVLNMASVYTLWRMIRDFFNLFLILTILFIAFATIFQVHAYNYKKLLWHLVLMALLVNFSFPVTRFIIDATNVPMYFFMESMFSDSTSTSGGQVLGSVFGASRISSMLIPDVNTLGGKNAFNKTVQLIGNIIFMFLFSMSLLVLGFLYLIRLVMLMVLIIFSPVGYIGGAVPGFEKYAKDWWQNLFKYALFGPSAMLILLVAVTFLEEFSMNNSATMQAITSQANSVTGNSAISGLVQSMAVTIVPIVLIWTAIGIGQKAGIEGAAGITSWAQKTSKTVGKRAPQLMGQGAARTYGAGMRKVTTTKDENGNIQARGIFAKNQRVANFVETQSARSQAKAKLREKERDQWKSRKRRRELYSQMSENDLLRELQNSQKGVSGMLGKVPGNMYGMEADAAQAIVKNGFHKKLDPDVDSVIRGADGKPLKNREVLQMIHGTLKSVGDKDSLKALESERADVMFEAVRRKAITDLGITDESKMTAEQRNKVNGKVKEKVEQWVADGEHKKASNVNVMNEAFVNTMVDSLGVDSAMSKIAEMPSNVAKKAEKVAEKSLENLSKDGAITGDWAATERWRKLGASVSSDAHKFFSMEFDGNGGLKKTIHSDLEKQAAEYANKMKSARIDKLNGEAAAAFAAVASVGYFQNAGEAKLDDVTKRQIFEAGIKRSDASITNELRDSAKWKSYTAKSSGLVDKNGRPLSSV